MSNLVPDDPNQLIRQPSGEHLDVWRYIDFTRFVSLLETQSLFFVRIVHLDDPFEGSFPISQAPRDRILELLPQGVFPDDASVNLAVSLNFEGHWKVMRNWAMVSCWHAVAHESAAMWKLYAPTGGGVAIRSTVGRLREAHGMPPPLPHGFFGGDRYHIGMIEYIDFNSSSIPIANGVAQFFRKRRSFEHEHELRALFMQWPINANGWFDYGQRPNDQGRFIPVDLKRLICEVRVAPQAPDWYLELVSKVAARYGIEMEPKRSELDVEPLY